MIDEATLAGLRAALEEHRDHLRSEIVGIGADPDADEAAFVDDVGFADSAHSTAERSRLLTVVTALRENLRDVERALVKIDRGTYGSCERCGRPIGSERLEALPWAALCIDCKRGGAAR